MAAARERVWIRKREREKKIVLYEPEVKQAQRDEPSAAAWSTESREGGTMDAKSIKASSLRMLASVQNRERGRGERIRRAAGSG